MIKKKFQMFFLAISTIIFLFILLFVIRISSSNDISNVCVRTENKAIEITWNTNIWDKIRKVEIEIKGQGYEKTVIMPAITQHYSFDEGVVGTVYTVSIKEIDHDGSYRKEFVEKRLFLDFDDLPDMPLLILETSTEPSYDAIYSSDGNWGTSIINNDYVSGSLTLTMPDNETVFSEMKIRYRGNTTTVNTDKKTYKIILDDAKDLLNLGGDYADKEWVLSGGGNNNNLRAYLGEYIGNYCGMEWQPRMVYVNVMLNGDWKGIYILSESVKRSPVRCNIGENGYLFENDVYYWNANGIFFRTENQINPLGFTVKYPKIKSADDEKMVKLHDYMQSVEDMIICNDDSLFDYIDADSFANWTLVRDIMGTADEGGSNMYFYINNINVDDYSENKLKMGPVWDFDMVFKASDDEWSHQHYWSGTYMNYLMYNEDFYKIYSDRWNVINDNLVDDLSENLRQLQEKKGVAINYSRKLEAERWEINYILLEDEIQEQEEYIKNRVEWMNQEIGLGDE